MSIASDQVLISLRSKDERVRLSMAPEEWEKTVTARNTPLSTILADHEPTSGEGLAVWSWSGMLPGPGRKDAAYVRSRYWEKPEEIAHRLEEWAHRGVVARLDISDSKSSSGRSVKVRSFTSTRRGGHGDIFYTIELVRHRPLEISRKKKKKKGGGKDRDESPDKDGKKGAEPGKGSGGKSNRKTYTVKAGDTLSSIAKRFLGSVTRWREIYDLNRKVIGPDPDAITPGMVLELP